MKHGINGHYTETLQTFQMRWQIHRRHIAKGSDHEGCQATMFACNHEIVHHFNNNSFVTDLVRVSLSLLSNMRFMVGVWTATLCRLCPESYPLLSELEAKDERQVKGMNVKQAARTEPLVHVRTSRRVSYAKTAFIIQHQPRMLI
jgi:hypothetical protein